MGSVPLMFEGSKYKGGIVRAIPQPPQFVSAEIGAVNASTLTMTFDRNISASDYMTGVMIKVNGVSTSITSATRQSDHAIVHYVIPVLWHGSGDTVTWEYASASGNIVAESSGVALGNVSAQTVMNNCEYAALLDLQADMLTLNNGDPVSTWADQSGAGHNFTQSSAARPIKQTIGGYAAVSFDGIDDWMLGSDFADNLDIWALMLVRESDNSVSGNNCLISKDADSFWGIGWSIQYDYLMHIETDPPASVLWNLSPFDTTTPKGTYIYEIDDLKRGTGENGIAHIYRDGIDISNGVLQASHSPDNYGNTEPVRLGTTGNSASDGYDKSNLYAVLIHQIFDLIKWPTNRAALEARLAARYGITL